MPATLQPSAWPGQICGFSYQAAVSVDRLASAVARRFNAKKFDEPEDNYSAGNLYVCAEDETVFLTKRSGVMHHPYKWDIPGGRSDKGEDEPEVTAAREAEEELHVLPKLAKRLTTHVERWTRKDGTPYEYHIFVYNLTEDEKVRWTPKVELDEENAGFKWFPLDGLPKKKTLHFDLSWLPALVRSKTKTASTTVKLGLEALKPRFEHKFWIMLDQAPAIREFIAKHVEADEHGRDYTIQNIYLDNPELEFFADHVVRQKDAHVKLRVRTYAASDEVFLEVKQKTAGVCSKVRSIVPASMYTAVLKTASLNAHRIPFVKLAIEHRSGPIIRLDYAREAYNAFEADGRITIDSNVRFSRHSNFAFSGPPTNQLLPPYVGILELKFSGEAPIFMKKLVATFGLRRRPISKYCMSVAELLQARELNQPPGLFG